MTWSWSPTSNCSARQRARRCGRIDYSVRKIENNRPSLWGLHKFARTAQSALQYWFQRQRHSLPCTQLTLCSLNYPSTISLSSSLPCLGGPWKRLTTLNQYRQVEKDRANMYLTAGENKQRELHRLLESAKVLQFDATNSRMPKETNLCCNRRLHDSLRASAKKCKQASPKT